MIRFLMYLLGKEDYESCKSCEILKSELVRAHYENEALQNSLLNLLKPTVVSYTPEPQELNRRPIGGVVTSWSVRKKQLEEEKRQEARIQAELNRKLDEIKSNEIKTTEELEEELLKNGTSDAIISET